MASLHALLCRHNGNNAAVALERRIPMMRTKSPMVSSSFYGSSSWKATTTSTATTRIISSACSSSFFATAPCRVGVVRPRGSGLVLARIGPSSPRRQLYTRGAVGGGGRHRRRGVVAELASSSVAPCVSCLDPMAFAATSDWFGRRIAFDVVDDDASSARRRRQQQRGLLATSGSNTALEGDLTWWQRFLRWIRESFEACWETVVFSIRGAEVVLRLSPLVVLTPACVWVARCWLEDDPDHVVRKSLCDGTWWYVTRTAQALGPAFVKLCQWIATRRDLFPPNVCDRLSALHANGNPHSWRETRRILEESFGANYEARGLRVDPDHRVLGCGSAAQVYRGTLLRRRRRRSRRRPPEADDDEENDQVLLPVAIKVLHPKFEYMVERDLRFFRAIARALHSAVPFEYLKMLNLPHVADNFSAVLRRQADLRIEGENLERFRANFYGGSNDDDDDLQAEEESQSSIFFPQPMEGWISRQVLVESLVDDATPIAAYIRSGGNNNDDELPTTTAVAATSSSSSEDIRKELASPLLRAFLKMVFLDNFVHGDLHPGNVLVQTTTVVHPEPSSAATVAPWAAAANGYWNRLTRSRASAQSNTQKRGDCTTTTTKRTIVFLDAGIATSLGPEDQRNLRDLFKAVILNDGNGAGRLMVERAKYERASQTPGGVEAFCDGIEKLVAEFHDNRKKGLTLGAVRIGSLLCRVLDLCRVHGVEIDPDMASVVISTLVLEGLGRSLEPDLNLIDFAVPFVLGRGRV